MEDQSGKTAETVRAFLRRHNWLSHVDRVAFLAAGEYNENYLIVRGDQRYVFRINHGTQLGLDDQARYEYAVLTAVEPSGRTPRPLNLCRTDPVFPRGAMLMEYIPGPPLDYEQDWAQAAELFAAIHSLPPAPGLIRQEHPVADIVTESRELLGRYPDHPLQPLGSKIGAFADGIAELGRQVDPEMARDRLCIVNTEVNSRNFIMSPAGLRLVDWEKAVVSYRYQDLGHFLVPTTTLWKSDVVFDPDRRAAFLQHYYEAAEPPVSYEQLDSCTGALERTIVLRALSWCYMAYAEYTQEQRALFNTDTFATIESYLERAEEFMENAGGP